MNVSPGAGWDGAVADTGPVTPSRCRLRLADLEENRMSRTSLPTRRFRSAAAGIAIAAASFTMTACGGEEAVEDGGIVEEEGGEEEEAD